MRAVVVVIGRCPGGLDDLRETTLAVVRLVTAVAVVGVAVVSRTDIRGTRRPIGLARRRLGCVLHDVLLFHECDKLIDVIVYIVKLHTSQVELELPVMEHDAIECVFEGGVIFKKVLPLEPGK